jgi:hypothetical protein
VEVAGEKPEGDATPLFLGHSRNHCSELLSWKAAG